jgi:acetyl-CoA synthetase
MEVESALVSHPSVAEAAAIGISHEIKGQALAVFVTPRAGVEGNEELQNELRAHVSEKIGAIARPDKIYFTAELPKTRSAKIMRRLLRDIAEGHVIGDTTTLADPTVLASIKTQYEDSEG